MRDDQLRGIVDRNANAKTFAVSVGSHSPKAALRIESTFDRFGPADAMGARPRERDVARIIRA